MTTPYTTWEFTEAEQRKFDAWIERIKRPF